MVTRERRDHRDDSRIFSLQPEQLEKSDCLQERWAKLWGQFGLRGDEEFRFGHVSGDAKQASVNISMKLRGKCWGQR